MSHGSRVEWKLSAYGALTTHELYRMLQLRAQVFVVEQRCVFQDLDGADMQAIHLQGTSDGVLVAYARCFGPGVWYAEASIGRVVARPGSRGLGLGHALVQRAMTAVHDTWGAQAIRIGAQAQLKRFYQHHGFDDVNKPYVEDGIDHLEMLRQPPRKQLT